MSLHLESEEDTMGVSLPLDVDPCARAAAQAHACSHLVTPSIWCIPGSFYMLQGLSDLMKHRVPIGALASCLHLATYSLILSLGKLQSPTCANSIECLGMEHRDKYDLENRATNCSIIMKLDSQTVQVKLGETHGLLPWTMTSASRDPRQLPELK